MSDIKNSKPEVKKSENKDLWSGWLDFNQSNITTADISDKSGVFKVHASMKILYITSSINLRKSLLELISDPCVSKARRFSYLVTDKAEQVKDQLLKEYLESHDGRMPECM